MLTRLSITFSQTLISTLTTTPDSAWDSWTPCCRGPWRWPSSSPGTGSGLWWILSWRRSSSWPGMSPPGWLCTLVCQEQCWCISISSCCWSSTTVHSIIASSSESSSSSSTIFSYLLVSISHSWTCLYWLLFQDWLWPSPASGQPGTCWTSIIFLTTWSSAGGQLWSLVSVSWSVSALSRVSTLVSSETVPGDQTMLSNKWWDFQ